MVILGIDLWIISVFYKGIKDFSEDRLNRKGLNLIDFWEINYFLNILNKSRDIVIKNFDGKIYSY